MWNRYPQSIPAKLFQHAFRMLQKISSTKRIDYTQKEGLLLPSSASRNPQVYSIVPNVFLSKSELMVFTETRTHIRKLEKILNIFFSEN